jgi:hypothetical protein
MLMAIGLAPSSHHNGIHLRIVVTPVRLLPWDSRRLWSDDVVSYCAMMVLLDESRRRVGNQDESPAWEGGSRVLDFVVCVNGKLLTPCVEFLAVGRSMMTWYC